MAKKSRDCYIKLMFIGLFVFAIIFNILPALNLIKRGQRTDNGNAVFQGQIVICLSLITPIAMSIIAYFVDPPTHGSELDFRGVAWLAIYVFAMFALMVAAILSPKKTYPYKGTKNFLWKP